MTSEQIKNRIHSIDIMRGVVILLMLVDHVRERFFLHMQVSDPMDVDTTSPGLFWSRFAAHFCAPTFIFLTGLSAWLYSHPANGVARSARSFLIKRGLFLIALEVTVICFSWMGYFHTIWLQVMWAIGLCMLTLALLINLPQRVLLVLGLLIVFGHNLLTPISFSPDEWGYTLWTILHDRGYISQGGLIDVKISYPVLPWIGVILLGYCAGPLYAPSRDSDDRKQWLVGLGLACVALFAILRGFNIYGETLPWQQFASSSETLMSVFNVTKYPPSLSFLLITLAMMFFGLWLFERPLNRFLNALRTFGSVPMFFYIVHLYALLVLYAIGHAIYGANQGRYFGVDHIGWIWLIAALLALALYWPTQWFSAYKRKSKKPWLKYL
ncbi:heparan-alpha-glucosaminide N-acetyltransferase domain-containing protein [Pseudoalteromonas haloplanktis]|uniref:Heparan-alpha-glucosaminide N-acetyltransferase domain-containing protein n=1 Tax=Pseudoalteromonas haloplanktis TaxID=228 RepID=A0ABU1BF03_PSEHA|nr:heparan-alpha-glucosaminide N-acetyltransferase domain-containing protein [Pseudoalteromonas haloplanktis]MDQ9092099.1 heparan-alpha-glucosaminide N-acetyltransferase domain-containing protein [Pseudoalteromonas haloplanktis]